MGIIITILVDLGRTFITGYYDGRSMAHTPGPSITSQPRTSDTHWLTLFGYVGLGIVVTIYVCWTVIAPSASPFSFRSGLILAGTALLSFLPYIALFRDAVHLSHTEIEWQPNWLGYFVVGFGVPLLVRLTVPSIPILAGSSALIIVYSLVFTTTGVCGVYLYRRLSYTPEQDLY